MCECNAKVKVNAADLSAVSYLHEHSHAAETARGEVLKSH